METINHEYYVSLEIAKLLKKAGFNWKTRYHYPNINSLEDNDKGYMEECPFYEDFNNSNSCSCPTLEIAQRWLRETQKYQVAILPNGLKGYAALCFLYKEPITQPFEHYSTYEEALEVGIKKVLEIILEKEK